MKTSERQREWLVEQVAVSMYERAAALLALDPSATFEDVVQDARRVNDRQEWMFDGPLTFSGRRLQPHERESWTRCSQLALDPHDFDRAVAMADQMLR